MILAGIQPSAVWFRPLQGMAALACDQLRGGCFSLCPTASQCVGPACWHRHGGKMLGLDSPLGQTSKALCFLWPCLVPRWQLTEGAGRAWAWAGPLESFLVALLGLQVPVVAHFGVVCSSNPAAEVLVPSRAVLGAGSSQERGLCLASKAQSSQANWSPLSLRDQHGCILQGWRGQKMCVPGLAVPWGKVLPPAPSPVPSGRAGRALTGTMLGLSLSPGRAPGAHISATLLWLSLGLASCALTSLLNGLCFINCFSCLCLDTRGRAQLEVLEMQCCQLCPA